MTERILGKAEYRAHRIGRLVTVTAIGEFPNFNDKADFDQLPFRIFPPEYGFYFIHQPIRIPTVKPFCYSEAIAFPTSAPFIIIVDADGAHKIPLKEIQIEEPVKDEPEKSEKGFCVFQNINGSNLSIAKCDVILPAIYRKVFGPASYLECEKYVSDNQGM